MGWQPAPRARAAHTTDAWRCDGVGRPDPHELSRRAFDQRRSPSVDRSLSLQPDLQTRSASMMAAPGHPEIPRRLVEVRGIVEAGAECDLSDGAVAPVAVTQQPGAPLLATAHRLTGAYHRWVNSGARRTSALSACPSWSARSQTWASDCALSYSRHHSTRWAGSSTHRASRSRASKNR